MSKIISFLYLVVFGGALLALRFILIPRVFPDIPSDAYEIWFASGLLLVVMGVFLTEKYFTKSLDVLVNVIALTFALWTVDSFKTFALYPAFFYYTGVVGIFALTSFLLFDDTREPSALDQRVARTLNKVATFLGSAKMLFSIVFILSFFSYFVNALSTNDTFERQMAALVLIVFWGAAILIEPIHRSIIAPLIAVTKGKDHPSLVGSIKKRVSPDTLILEEFKGAPALEFGKVVVLSKKTLPAKLSDCCVAFFVDYQDAEDTRYMHCYLVEGQELKTSDLYAYAVSESHIEGLEKLTASALYKNRDRMVGTVYAGSEIDVIRIKMIPGIDQKYKLAEGDLLSADFAGQAIKYQIINVKTDFENVTTHSKTGMKIITAQQIGKWDKGRHAFKNFNWVPNPNAPVFLESTEGITVPDKGSQFYKVGVVPKSKYPVYIDLEKAISHHIAVIGKTGTGKSRMAAKMVEQMAKHGCKVVIFEVDRDHKESLTRYIDATLIEEQESNTFDISKATKNIIAVKWSEPPARKEGGTSMFAASAADVLQKILAFQVSNESAKVSIVMEEAYDFVPENNFGKQDFGSPEVNRINQLALKCRKHKVGFVIITQRTAIVTKTMLYQCHTVIALQSFDETSKSFMSAYIDHKYLDSMSVLPRFRAIVVGKGSTCDKPVIVDFEDTSLSST